MAKRVNPTQKKVVFVPKADMSGDHGTTISYNKSSRRYDLRQNGKLNFSHVTRDACIRVAKNVFGVEMTEG